MPDLSEKMLTIRPRDLMCTWHTRILTCLPTVHECFYKEGGGGHIVLAWLARGRDFSWASKT